MREGFVTVPGGKVFHRTVGKGAPGIQARIPGAEPRMFENASHSHHLEQPGAYLTTVSDFQQRVKGGQAVAQG